MARSLVAAAVLSCAANAVAAETPLPVLPTISQPDAGNYCIYADTLYSFGAGLCVGISGYVCVPSGTDGEIGNNRGVWHRADAGAYLAPGCVTDATPSARTPQPAAARH